MRTQTWIDDYQAVSLNLDSDTLERSDVRHLAHDLRNPLQALLGFVWTLNKTAKASHALSDETVRSIAGTSNRIEKITDYLDRVLSGFFEEDESVSATEAGYCDLDQCFVDAIEYSSYLDVGRLAYQPRHDESLLVSANPMHIRQLFVTVISSALLGTPPGLNVACAFHVVEDEIHLSVMHDLSEPQREMNSGRPLETSEYAFHLAKIAEFAAIHRMDLSVTHAPDGKAVALQVSFKRA